MRCLSNREEVGEETKQYKYRVLFSLFLRFREMGDTPQISLFFYERIIIFFGVITTGRARYLQSAWVDDWLTLSWASKTCMNEWMVARLCVYTPFSKGIFLTQFISLVSLAFITFSQRYWLHICIYFIFCKGIHKRIYERVCIMRCNMILLVQEKEALDHVDNESDPEKEEEKEKTLCHGSQKYKYTSKKGKEIRHHG